MWVNEDAARRMLVAMGLGHAGSPEKMSRVKLTSCLDSLQVLLDESEDLAGDDLVLQKRIFKAIADGDSVQLEAGDSPPDDGVLEVDRARVGKEVAEEEDEKEEAEDAPPSISTRIIPPTFTGRGQVEIEEKAVIGSLGIKRGRGRPPGSKNKQPKVAYQAALTTPAVKRGPGRPRKETTTLLVPPIVRRKPGRPRKNVEPPSRRKLERNKYGAVVGSDVDRVCRCLSRKFKTEAELRKEAGVKNSVEYFLDKLVRMGYLTWQRDRGYALVPKSRS